MKEFDVLSIRDTFKNDIQEIFSNAYDTLQNEVDVITFNEQETTYPCCLVDVLNPISAERYNDNDSTFNYIDLSLNCELYSKSLNDYNNKDAVIKLSQILINGLLTKYPTLVVTRNDNAPFRDDVSRRVVSFRCTYDNDKNRVYSN